MKFVKSGITAALLVAAAAAVGCKSSYQEGVTSNYRTQKTMVYADVQTTANAAKQVFEGDNLKNVSIEADKVKGEVSGDLADKTKVYASVEKADNDKGSTLWVQVGRGLGDPKIGADYAARIKQVAEGKK